VGLTRRRSSTDTNTLNVVGWAYEGPTRSSPLSTPLADGSEETVTGLVDGFLGSGAERQVLPQRTKQIISETVSRLEEPWPGAKKGRSSSGVGRQRDVIGAKPVDVA
jgi:hypothetical protein